MNKGMGGEKKEGEGEEKVRDERVEKNELTKLVCLFDPKEADLLEDDKTKKSYIIGVGWDRKIHIWQDDKGQEEETLRTLPQNNQQAHNTDIMSCTCYYKDNVQMIYTGGHDGTLISWSMDTGSAKRYLHDKDPTCLASSKEPNQAIRESKSVDALLILELR